MAVNVLRYNGKQLRYSIIISLRKPEIAQMDEAATILDIWVTEGTGRHETMQRKGQDR